MPIPQVKQTLVGQPNAKPKMSVVIRSEAIQQLIRDMVASKEVAETVTSEILYMCGINPKLGECDIGSLIISAVRINKSGLPALMDYYYLIPRNVKGNMMAMFQISYRGLLQLCYGTGAYKFITAVPVRDGEYKGRDELTAEPVVRFYKSSEEAEKHHVVGYYGVFILANTGLTKAVYWTVKDIEKHRDTYAKSYGNGKETDLWRDKPTDMALKTVLINLIRRWGVLTKEMAEIVKYDSAVETKDGAIIYPDNPNGNPDEPDGDTTPKKEIEVNPTPKEETNPDVFSQAEVNDFGIPK